MSSEHDAEQPPKGSLLPGGMTAAEFTRQSATFPTVPADQPPPADMPPMLLMVPDALADDSETIDTMRNCSDIAAYGVALGGESHLLEAIRSLLDDGLRGLA